MNPQKGMVTKSIARIKYLSTSIRLPQRNKKYKSKYNNRVNVIHAPRLPLYVAIFSNPSNPETAATK